MVKISSTIELSVGDIESTSEMLSTEGDRYITRVESKRIINLAKKLDYPVNVMYEVHYGNEVMQGYLTGDGKRIIEI